MAVYITWDCDFTDETIHRAVIARVRMTMENEMRRVYQILRSIKTGNAAYLATVEPLLIHHTEQVLMLEKVALAHIAALTDGGFDVEP